MMQSMKTSGSVVFLDSGVGGLPYLAEAKSLLPHLTMHYLADDGGFPYGTKTPRQVQDLLYDRVRRLRSRFIPEALVIACNTASQVGLQSLREAHPGFQIIGTIPAIKPAAASSRTGVIGVMATERTVVDPYIDDLIARYASDVDVVKLPAQDLVSFVERRYLHSTEEERIGAVEPYIRFLLERNVDRIVLACTHFLHLEKDILNCVARLGGHDVEIIDSRRGVANRLVQVMGGTDLPGGRRGTAAADTPGSFLLTSDPPFDSSYALWAECFGLLAPERL